MMGNCPCDGAYCAGLERRIVYRAVECRVAASFPVIGDGGDTGKLLESARLTFFGNNPCA